MYCNLHAKHFLSEVGCEVCKVGWTEDTTALTATVEKLEVKVEDLRKEKEEFKELFEHQKEQNRKLATLCTESNQREEQAKNFLAMEKTKSEHLRVSYRRAEGEREEIREQLAKCKGKLDSSQWEGSAYADLVKILYSLLEKHNNRRLLCYPGSNLCKETEQALGSYNPTSQDILIDQLRRAGLTSEDPIGREKLPRRKLTGLIPGGMIETHDVDCGIWTHSSPKVPKCTCGGPYDR